MTDRLTVKFEGGASNNDAFIWDEFAIEYRVNPNLLISAGNLKAAGLENLTSTKAISFLERGPYGDLVTDPFTSSLQIRAPLERLSVRSRFRAIPSTTWGWISTVQPPQVRVTVGPSRLG